jgi:hypothetical protein
MKTCATKATAGYVSKKDRWWEAMGGWGATLISADLTQKALHWSHNKHNTNHKWENAIGTLKAKWTLQTAVHLAVSSDRWPARVVVVYGGNRMATYSSLLLTLYSFYYSLVSFLKMSASRNIFSFFQFYIVTRVGIMHKMIEPNLAKIKMKEKYLTTVLIFLATYRTWCRIWRFLRI